LLNIVKQPKTSRIAARSQASSTRSCKLNAISYNSLMDALTNIRALEVDSLPLAAALLDEAGRIVHGNPSLFRLFRHQAELTQGVAFDSLVADAEGIRFSAKLAACIAMREPVEFTIRLHHRPADERWRLELLPLASDAHASVARALLKRLAVDVPEVEDTAFAGMQRGGFDLTHEAILFSEEDRVVDANLSACRLLRFERHGLIQVPLLELFGSEAALDRILKRARATMPGAPTYASVEVVCGDGSHAALDVSISCQVRGNPGRAVFAWTLRPTVLQQIPQEVGRDTAAEALLQMRALVDSLPEVVWLKSPEGRYVVVNQRFEQLYGLTTEQVIGKTAKDLLSPAEVKVSEEMDREALTSNLPVTADFSARFHGEDRQFELTKIAIRRADGELIGIVASAVEMTRANAQSAELANAKSFLNAVIENLPTAVAVRSAHDGKYVHYNRAAEKLTGRAAVDVLGVTPYDVYPPSDADDVEGTMRLVVQTGQVVSTTTTATNQLTGKSSAITRTSVPIFDEHGKVQFVMNLAEDISNRVEQERALRESDARFRQFASNIDQALFWGDPARPSWQFQNGVLEQILGVSRIELMSRPDLLMQLTHEEDRQLFQAATTRERLLERSDVEFRVRPRGGGIRWVRMRSSASLAEDGSMRVFGTLDDITDHKRIEAERLESVVEQRDVLIREVHHRIKNNLQGVAGLLLHASRAKPTLASELKDVSNQIQAIAHVHGLQTHGESTFFVGDLVRAVFRNLASSLGKLCEFSPNEVAVRKYRLAESEGVPIALILNELGSNAYRHGTGSVGVTLREVGPDTLQIDVWNDGHLPEGFDMSKRNRRPSGLGLVQALVPRQCGKLSIEQESGRVVASIQLWAPAVSLA
jgi:PAS domain S-box-containing protein